LDLKGINQINKESSVRDKQKLKSKMRKVGYTRNRKGAETTNLRSSSNDQSGSRLHTAVSKQNTTLVSAQQFPINEASN
jgi:hypothetical protein